MSNPSESIPHAAAGAGGAAARPRTPSKSSGQTVFTVRKGKEAVTAAGGVGSAAGRTGQRNAAEKTIKTGSAMGPAAASAPPVQPHRAATPDRAARKYFYTGAVVDSPTRAAQRLALPVLLGGATQAEQAAADRLQKRLQVRICCVCVVCGCVMRDVCVLYYTWHAHCWH
jgi:hypothetical protein